MNPRSLAAVLGDWQAAGPSYRAVADAIRLAIRDGRLALDTPLPSERALAAHLQVSRTTVTAAYATLRDQGYLNSRPGARSVVMIPTATSAAADPMAGDRIGLNIAAPGAPEGVLGPAFAAAVDELPRFLPITGLADNGLLETRSAVAARYTARGVPTDPDEIIITAGAQHALRLLFDVLCPPGSAIAVDQPVHAGTVLGIRRAGLRPLAVPLRLHTPDTAWDFEALETTLRQHRPRAVFTIADNQNPSGTSLSESGRATLTELCRRYEVPLIVDETVAELSFAASCPPVAAFSRSVITIGSLSKSVWAGLRIGWIRAPRPLVATLTSHRTALDIASPVVEQLAAAHALARYPDFLPQRRTMLHRNSIAAAAAIVAAIPGVQVNAPTGGLVLWCTLPAGGPGTTALAAAADRRGVWINPGTAFSVSGAQHERNLRLPYCLPAPELTQAIALLGEAYHDLRSGQGTVVAHRPSVVV